MNKFFKQVFGALVLVGVLALLTGVVVVRGEEFLASLPKPTLPYSDAKGAECIPLLFL